MLEQPDQTARRGEPMFNVPGSVLALLVILAAVHALRMYSARLDDWMLAAFAFIPARYTGALPPLPELYGQDGLVAVTSFLTYGFLHADWTHLIVNGVWMLAFGSAVARHLGSARFLAFSAFAAIIAAAFYLPFHWGERSLMIGASGAISGQMAAAVRLIYAPGGGRYGALRLGEVLRERRAIMFLAVWAAVNVAFGLSGAVPGEGSGEIAWQAHFGGFAAGLLSLGLFERRRAG